MFVRFVHATDLAASVFFVTNIFLNGHTFCLPIPQLMDIWTVFYLLNPGFLCILERGLLFQMYFPSPIEEASLIVQNNH